jgi:FixJ family two-component response regulator
MTDKTFTVFIVDDDDRIVRALSRLMRLKGYEVQSHTSPQEFLGRHDASVPGCAILDVAMPGLDGLELQQALTTEGSQRPVIFITGKGSVPTSVRAMRAGAIDFLTKPVSNDDLLEAVARAKDLDAKTRQTQAQLSDVRSRTATLTPREREVLTHVVSGQMNKQIAFDLGTVEKTIKFHRSAGMKKLGIRTVADLVRMAEKAGLS